MAYPFFIYEVTMTQAKLNPQVILATYYAFDLAATTISLIKTGQENENYLVTAHTQKFVLRIYNQDHSLRGTRSKAEIEQEMNFMVRAQNAGLFVPQVIKNQTGDTITVLEVAAQIHFCALFHFIEGTTPLAYSEKIACEVGKIVNTLFTVSKSFADEQHTLRYDMWTYSLQKYDAVHPVHEGLNQLHKRVMQECKTIPLAALSQGFVHNDLKLGNLLFDESENLTAVLDFDDFRYGYLLEDAGMAILHNLHSTEENLLRAGYYPVFIAQLTQPQLADELPNLSFFMRVRFLYDVSAYLENGLFDLVESLFADKQIQTYILM